MNAAEVVELDLDLPRRCMLLERVGGIFDQIPMAEPIPRVMMVAKGIQEASAVNENIRNIVKEVRFIESLKGEALFRQTGQLTARGPLPAALVADLPRNNQAREGAHV